METLSLAIYAAISIVGSCVSVLLAIRNTPGAEQAVSRTDRIILILAGSVWPIFLTFHPEDVVHSPLIWIGYTTFCCILLYGATVDLASYRLPNFITFGSFGLLLLIRIAVGFENNSIYSDVMFTLNGAFVAAGGLWIVRKIYFFLRRKHGIGGGDIKLLLSLGGFVGTGAILALIFVASVLGIVTAFVYSLTKGTDFTRKSFIPFGPFLCASAVIIKLWGLQVISFLLP